MLLKTVLCWLLKSGRYIHYLLYPIPNISLMIMYYHVKERKWFDNRKQAKEYYGVSRFRKLFHLKEIIFTETNSIANDELYRNPQIKNNQRLQNWCKYTRRYLCLSDHSVMFRPKQSYKSYHRRETRQTDRHRQQNCPSCYQASKGCGANNS